MIRYFFLTVILAVFMWSCNSSEPEKFHQIEFDVDGINLEDTDKGLLGEIPSEGAEFTITGKGKYADMVYVTSIFVDGVPQEREGNLDEGELLDTYVVLKGDWGEVKYLTTTPPYKMIFNLFPNSSDKTRVYEFQLGFGYWYKTFRINQAGKPS